jgi:hypothetical protein
MISLEAARVLGDGGLPGMIAKAKRAGGEAFAEEMVEGFLRVICDAACAELGRTRARELFEMRLTALERGGA